MPDAFRRNAELHRRGRENSFKRKSAKSSRVNLGCRANHAAPRKIFDLELRGRFARLHCARRFFSELEADFSIFEFQMRREGPSLFRDKAWQEIGLASVHQFLHLFLWNRSVQDCFAHAKAALLRHGGSPLADVGIFKFEDLPFFAHWTEADRLMS